jgi:hypothetical protein
VQSLLVACPGKRQISDLSRAHGLPLPRFAAISPRMLKTSAQIIEQVYRGTAAVRERSRSFTSLLLLGLTRGCRVL